MAVNRPGIWRERFWENLGGRRWGVLREVGEWRIECRRVWTGGR
jgi:hypothetical protein